MNEHTRLWRFRHVATRFLNPFTRLFAGWAPAFGILTHRGRNTGRFHRTPINVFRRGDHYVFFLTYGPDVEWVKNVFASGRCELRTGGRDVTLIEPELIADPQRRMAPAVVRPIGRLLGATRFVRMRAAGPKDPADDLRRSRPSPTPSLSVRAVEARDGPRVEAFLSEHGAIRVARLGELVDARGHPSLLCEHDGRLVGLLTYIVDGERCEILTLHAAERWRGVGTALVDEGERLAITSGCRRLWLITTNDNLDALRFYQRRGFRLAKLHEGAVDRSRESLKPEIPTVGEYGIPIRDEIELIKDL